MTIIYQFQVATASLGGFGKLLLKWRGSVYKLLYKEVAIFVSVYTLLSLTYRLLLSEVQKRVFEKIAIHCNSYTSLIPISFVLGFYVSLVVTRWWEQFCNIPWPDRSLFTLNAYLTGTAEHGRLLRRTLARYILFSTVLICRSISVAVMKRFPTLDHLVEAGIATRCDIEMYESIDCDYNKFWIPLVWANGLIVKARNHGRIETDFGLQMILQQLADFRDKCSKCFVYDWVTIPLVYTQVVTLAVYMFFAACLVGRQYLDTRQGYQGYNYDLYVPFFTILQFIFYFGWLKVAEQLINPFGEDDDDFDINWLIDRHVSVSMIMVDQCHGQLPELSRDSHWNERKISGLPYTEESMNSKKPIYLGSTFNLQKISSTESKQNFPVNVTKPQGNTKWLSTSLVTLLKRRSSHSKQSQCQPYGRLLSSQSDLCSISPINNDILITLSSAESGCFRVDNTAEYQHTHSKLSEHSFKSDNTPFSSVSNPELSAAYQPHGKKNYSFENQIDSVTETINNPRKCAADLTRNTKTNRSRKFSCPIILPQSYHKMSLNLDFDMEPASIAEEV